MEGSVVGTAYDGSQLIVYTNQGPDHGAMVQTSEASTNPLGLSIGTVSNLVFDGVPEAGINGQSFYKGNMQEMLVGNSLFIGRPIMYIR